MSIILSDCYECKHLNKETSTFTCAAFPEGIPTDILKSDRKGGEICKDGIHFEEMPNK